MAHVLVQLGEDIQRTQQTIADLRVAIEAAKEKQKTAKNDVKKLEKDMDEFKNNKEGKIDELKVRQASTSLRLVVFSPFICQISPK